MPMTQTKPGVQATRDEFGFSPIKIDQTSLAQLRLQGMATPGDDGPGQRIVDRVGDALLKVNTTGAKLNTSELYTSAAKVAKIAKIAEAALGQLENDTGKTLRDMQLYVSSLYSEVEGEISKGKHDVELRTALAKKSPAEIQQLAANDPIVARAVLAGPSPAALYGLSDVKVGALRNQYISDVMPDVQDKIETGNKALSAMQGMVGGAVGELSKIAFNSTVTALKNQVVDEV